MDTKEKLKLKKFVNELDSTKGRHTELVTYYIPTGYSLHKIIEHLFQEQHTATNIKDARTRKNVIDSIEKVIRHLRLYKKTPENGLAVFAGNVSKNESQIKIEVFHVEPPQPLQTRLYRCDQKFVTNILKDMMEHKESYGLLVVDRREGNIGMLKGTAIVELASFTSNVPGKTTKGGQSQQRYARLREEAMHEFFKRIGDAVNKEFLELKDMKGLLVGGPGPTKEYFIDGYYMDTRIKAKIKSVQDLSYTGEFGLNELVDKSSEALAEESIIEEKQIMEDFFSELAKGSKKVRYGEKDVIDALDKAAVKKILVSEKTDQDLIDKLEQKAVDTGAEIMMISVDTREGEQLRNIGKVAAFLRYELQ
ncbi:peptide chain release factor aRF-1 [archaeon]|jgi:peptide chain release factor subunit 1|nr:peptide chain release factor aRF-1 [archaeon]MBT6824183.1 peptide chain release factor aRF-1 [archaeon]MBT7106973.1 peptide chain release factor aRF-1 [archaeon]MBT7297585.1 peptide chain release factor aRF-1 [archaeon]